VGGNPESVVRYEPLHASPTVMGCRRQNVTCVSFGYKAQKKETFRLFVANHQKKKGKVTPEVRPGHLTSTFYLLEKQTTVLGALMGASKTYILGNKTLELGCFRGRRWVS